MKILIFFLLLSFQFCATATNRSYETAKLQEDAKAYLEDAKDFDCSKYSDADQKIEECEKFKKKGTTVVKEMSIELEKKDTANTILINEKKNLQEKADNYDYYRNIIFALIAGFILYKCRNFLWGIIQKVIL
ncbi:MAG: hypothetical protein KA146_00445 [Leptospiraceae bacterium]|nr:hypothetical protein [Leptospiraceae bacterium]